MKENVMAALKRAYEKLEQLGYNVIAVMLYGSQNYGIDTVHSDIDLKAIVIPTYEDIIKGNKLISKTIEMNFGLVDIKDLRLMIECYKKQNLNFLETLITDYKIINPVYEEYINKIFNNEKIMRYDERKAIKCAYGMIKDVYHNAVKMNVADRYKEEEQRFINKTFSNILRLSYFIYNYIHKIPYKDCITPSEDTQDYILKLRNNQILLTKDEFINRTEDILDYLNNIIKINEPYFKIDNSLEPLFDNVIEDIMYKFLLREIEKRKILY